RPHEQAAVAAAVDGEHHGGGVLAVDQVPQHAAKSSKTFCLVVRWPAACHSSPNSPPPRRLATATTNPWSNATRYAGSRPAGTPPSCVPQAVQHVLPRLRATIRCVRKPRARREGGGSRAK